MEEEKKDERKKERKKEEGGEGEGKKWKILGRRSHRKE